MKISLVVPFYNREKYLKQCCDSVLSQTFPDWECILWDDGSTDGSREIADSYVQKDKRFRSVHYHHQGYAQSLYDAISNTKGELIGFLDSDDWLHPECLQKTVQPYLDGWDCGVVYTQYINVLKDGTEKLGTLSAPFDRDKLIFPGYFMSFHFRLFKKFFYDQVGGIDTSFSTSVDYDLCLRLSEVCEFAYIPEPLYYYRHHDEQTTATKNDIQLLNCKRASQNAIDRRGLPYKAVLGWNVVAKNN